MADTKNFGLKGVGDDVQFGKGGGRFVFNTGASDFRATTDGTTLAHLQVLDPVGNTDAATKLYVDNVAQGLDSKESVTCATTATTGTYNSTGGPLSNGQLTSVAATIDGVNLAEGDRVLIKNHSTAAANGIYVVTATTTTLNRAADFDEDDEVTAGAYCFVEEGTTNANSGWVLQGPDPLTVGGAGGSDLNFVLFSTSSSIVAGTGLVKNGDVLDLDFSELASQTTIALADELIFQDGGTAESRITVTNFLADRDIVTATGGNGILTKTANDTYAARTLTASAVAGDEGISIVDGDGVSGNPTIGIDIVGQTNLVTDDVDDADELLLYHSVAGGTEGVGNYAVTALKLKNYMNAGTSTSSITAGDSTLQVTDAGTGQMEFNIDGGSQQVLITAAQSTFNNDVNISTGNTLTVVDLTNNDVLIAGTGGLVEDSGGLLTFDGTTLALTGNQTITVDSATTAADIPVLTLRATSTGTPAAGIGPSIEFEAETSAGAPGNVEIGGLLALEATDVTSTSEDFDFVFQLMSAGAAAAEVARITSTGSLFLDEKAEADPDVAGQGQIWVDIATTNDLYYTDDTGQDVQLTNNGAIAAITGTVANNQVVTGTGTSAVDSSANLTFDGTTLTVTGVLIVDEITIDGDTISNNTTDQPLILRPNGTGSLILQNGSGEEGLEILDTVSAVNGLAITPGATGVAPLIAAGTGAEANIDIGFLGSGTGVLTVTGTTNYEAQVTDDDDIPNKKYVDDAIQSLGGSGAVDTVTGTVDLTTASTQNIGAATGIPANCTIMSVTLDVTTASDAVTTVTVGDATNGAASYMAATENDPETLGIYIADGRLLNGAGDRQATATVATPGTVGAATCIITFRHN